LGFRFPEPLRRVYLEVANGGFGPGYGLVGVAPTGARIDGLVKTGRAVEVYREARDHGLWLWPEGFLPLVHLGCGDWLAGDLQDPAMPIYPYGGGDAPVERHGRSFESLQDWLQAWLDRGGQFGKNLG